MKNRMKKSIDNFIHFN